MSNNEIATLGFSPVNRSKIAKCHYLPYPVYGYKVSRAAGGRICLTATTGSVFRICAPGETLAEFLNRASNGLERGLHARVFGIWGDRIVLIGTGIDESNHKERMAKAEVKEPDYW